MAKTESRAVPMGKNGMPAGMPQGKKGNPMKTIKRLLQYMTKYKLRLVFVLVCIVISAGAGVASSLFIQILIDNYITPLLTASEKDFSGLLTLIFIMGAILLLGAVATLLYNRLMVTISHEYLPFFYEMGLLRCNPYLICRRFLSVISTPIPTAT